MLEGQEVKAYFESHPEAVAVIENTEGLGVSKSFCLTGESAADLRQSFAKSRDANLTFERQHTPWERALQIL